MAVPLPGTPCRRLPQSLGVSLQGSGIRQAEDRQAGAGRPRQAGPAGRRPAVLFHDLRRSFTKDAVDAGNDHKTVMDLGGWKTVATFHRYKIVDKRQMAKALSRLEDARKAANTTRVIPLTTATKQVLR